MRCEVWRYKAETMLEETEINPSGTVVIGMKISKDNGEYMLFHPGVDLAGVLLMKNAISATPRMAVMWSILED